MESSSQFRSGPERPGPEPRGRSRRARAGAPSGPRRAAGRNARPAPEAHPFADMAEYIERQPFGALIAAAMTGYAIAWYLRGGSRAHDED